VTTRLPILLIALTGCGTMVEAPKMMYAREGTMNTYPSGTVLLRWDAPTTGPRPDGYDIYINGQFYDYVQATECAIPSDESEAEYEVYSTLDGIQSHEPCKLTMGLRITRIEVRDNGVILAFPTRIGSTYSVERAETIVERLSEDTNFMAEKVVWVEVCRFVADAAISQRGGDASAPRAFYRAWRLG
jgi:hypothetical protein